MLALLGIGALSSLFTAAQSYLLAKVGAGVVAVALVVALVVAGITFIATLLIIALLMLVVDPAQVAKQIDRPVLLPDDEPEGGASDVDRRDDSA